MFGLIDRIGLASRHRKFIRVGDIELQLLGLLSAPGRRALDIGANIGVYSYELSRLGRQVTAFEPIPELAASINRARLRGVECINCALSDHEGETTLNIPLHKRHKGRLDRPGANIRGGEQGPSIAVKTQVRSLDSFGFEDAGFIKIDVEGVERAVLTGAKDTIARCRPNVEIELVEWLSPGCIQWTRDYFEALGFTGLYVAGRREVLPLDGAPPREGVENFIFAPAESAEALSAAIRQKLGG